jgi:cell division septal protein FtsQ
MRKKKELPRKRKRFVKKIIFFSSAGLLVIIMLAGYAYYQLVYRFEKAKIPPPIFVAKISQPDQSDVLEQELANDLNNKQISYTNIKNQDGEYIVTLQDNSKVTFSSQKDIMAQIASLQYILSHLTMEGRQFSSLDLRFDQPVIVLIP